jgi:hypothetical protein
MERTCRTYAAHLHDLAQTHPLDPIRRFADILMNTYDTSLKAGCLKAADVHLTIPDIREYLGENREPLRAFVHEAFLGLFNISDPRVIYLGPETAASPAITRWVTRGGRPRERDTLLNFVLEVLYLPLLRRFSSRGDVIAAIAGEGAEPHWNTSQVVFSDCPAAYYPRVHHSHTWASLDRIQHVAEDGGLVGAYVNERSCQPGRNSEEAKKAGKVLNGILPELIGELRVRGRVLVFHGGNFSPFEQQIAATFLGCELDKVELERLPSGQFLRAKDFIDAKDKLKRWVVYMPQASRRGLPRNADRDLVGLAVRELLREGPPEVR